MDEIDRLPPHLELSTKAQHTIEDEQSARGRCRVASDRICSMSSGAADDEGRCNSNMTRQNRKRDQRPLKRKERAAGVPGAVRCSGKSAHGLPLCLSGAAVCALTLRALDQYAGTSMSWSLPIASAYELYKFDGLFSEDIEDESQVPSDNSMDVFPEIAPRVYRPDVDPVFDNDELLSDSFPATASDDDISEEDIVFDDDFPSGDATYTNENVAGVYHDDSYFRYDSNGDGAAPTPQLSTAQPTPKPTKRPRQRRTRKPTSDPTLDPTSSSTESPTSSPTSGPTVPPTISPTTKSTASKSALPSSSPTTAQPSKTPTFSPTNLASFAPSQMPSAAPTQGPTVSSQPSAAPTVPIPYTFNVQMTPFEIMLTSMDDTMSEEDLKVFNMFSDKQIADIWVERQVEDLSEEDAQMLKDGVVEITFTTIVTSQKLADATTSSGANLEFRTTDDTDDASASPTSSPTTTSSPTVDPFSSLSVKSKKSAKSTAPPTSSPTFLKDKEDGGGRRLMDTETILFDRRGEQNSHTPQHHRRIKKKKEEVAGSGIEEMTIRTTTPPIQQSLSVQQTKIAHVKVRGKHLLGSHPEIMPTRNNLDTVVQITYGSSSPDLVAVLKDYNVEAFEELHSIDFLHFFYPTSVGGVVSIIDGSLQPARKTLSGGAVFGIVAACMVAVALLGLLVKQHRSQGTDKYGTSKTSRRAPLKQGFSSFYNATKARLALKSPQKHRESPSGKLGADKYLEEQYDDAIYEYEMDSYISSLGFGGISGSFDTEPGFEGRKKPYGSRKVRFQEEDVIHENEAYVPTPTINNRARHNFSPNANVDGVVYLCEKEEGQGLSSRNSGQGVEGIFSSD